MLAKIFAALRDEGVTRADVAQALQVELEEVDCLVFRLILTGLTGGAPNGGSGAGRPPKLTVVK